MPQETIHGMDPATGSVTATDDRFEISRETSPGVWETFYVTQQWIAAYCNAILTVGASAGMNTFAEVETSPAFLGTPTAPTADPGTNTTQLATTAFMQAALAALVDSSPATLDTLNELAAALGDDPNFATTTATALGLKAPLASPALTGNPTAPNATAGANSTQLATTAYIDRDRWRVLARGNVAIPLTGTTSETDYVLVTVPGGAMGPNGLIRITTLASAGANNANAKNIRYRFGGNAFQNFSLASMLSHDGQRVIGNRNSQSAQVAPTAGASTFVSSAAAVATTAIDTSANFDIRITGLLANAGDTLTMERYLIEILYGA